MPDIKKITGGWSGIRAKINELVTRVNALSGTTVVRYDPDEPRADQLAELLEVGTNQAFLKLRPQSAGGGAAGAAGILLISHDGSTQTFVSTADILASYAEESNWSVELTISSLRWDGSAPAYNTNTGEYDVTGTSQAKARIPIYRGGNFVATYGVYKEGLAVEDGELYAEFYAK